MRYLLFCCCLLTWQASYSQTLPALTLPALKLELAKQDDTLRVVNLWATWCKPCVEELPAFTDLAYQYSAEGRQVKFLLIAVEDTPEKVQAFLEKKQYFQKKDTKNNPNTPFYVLTERDANLWIPEIDPKWEGEIPATLLLMPKYQIRNFQAKQLTHNELETLIQIHLKKN